MEIRFGHPSVRKFLTSLPPTTYTRTLRMLALLEKHGQNLRMPHTKRLEPDLYELRILGAHQIRLFYTFYLDAIVVLHGFLKKSQRLPIQEIAVAKMRLKTLS